jgi:hypothetical protein
MTLRDDYQALMEKQLNEWKAQTERLKVGAAQVEASLRAQYDANLESLRQHQAAAWDNFGKLKSANEGAWEGFKTHMDKAGAELKSAVETLTATSAK